jgi:hypothetical protein
MVVHKVFNIESLQNEIQSLCIYSHQVFNMPFYENKYTFIRKNDAHKDCELG